ncbi:MAG TPA: polymer-forming cytoskeletal protein [Polyangiaceae bacterium]|nr:polymer-forming cytoskeletal protein [Polyangiaceae bacterium]
MARASSSTSQGGGTAILGKGTHVRGRVAGEGDLRVEGAISGDVALKGHLVVSDGGEVVADVEAKSVIVEGAIEGDISVSEGVAIRASARVSGAIRGSSISIEEGANVSGRIEADFELPPELGGKSGR